MGFDLFRDGLSTNTCICRPPKNRTPKPNEIDCCRVKLLQVIKEHKPNVIILLGGTAVESIIGRSWKKGLGGITKWRGWAIPDREHKAWICPVYHPSFVARKQEKNGDNLARVIWENDLKKALSYINEKVPIFNEEKDITYIESNSHFKSIFQRIMRAELMEIDYETTGLKPHAKGHKITNLGVAIDEKECYSWVNNPYRAKLFAKVLANPRIKKMAHNVPFENMWSKIIFKTDVKNWYWDSLVNAHILDNRKGVGGLKFQTYVNFGVADYDSHISSYLRSPDKAGANAFNNIEKFFAKYGERDALKYCGLDNIFGFKLSIKQMKQMGLKWK